MTIPNKLSLILPKLLKKKLRQPWHNIELFIFFFKSGGRFFYNSEVGNICASKSFPGSKNKNKIPVVTRSSREMKRWMVFGRDGEDKLYKWLLNLHSCKTLWDIGSANGLEGFMVNFLHGSKVVFVEPFTPSIESILKTKFLIESRLLKNINAEIVHAACDIEKGYEKLINHTKPVAGETFNSIEKGIDDYCDGGRKNLSKKSLQWIKKITLDEMLLEMKIDAPSHLKIDVDGLELRVLNGGKEFFKKSMLSDCAIEVNDENPKAVVNFMKRYGFIKYDENIHHSFKNRFTADFFFKRT